MPWIDSAGTLSDPSLRVLFYSVDSPENEIHLDKDLASDSIRIRF